MVEFALTWFLFFMVTVVGVMDLGRGIWAFNLLAHAAHQGVRYAMVRGSTSEVPCSPSRKSACEASADDIRDFVRGQALTLPDESVTVTTTWEPDNDADSVVQVQVQHAFRPLLGPLLLSDTIGLTKTARMRISQ